jgi:uncharacterized protein (TIGR02271 family)
LLLFILCLHIINMNADIDWNDTIKKEARGSNDEDLGEVQEIANGYVVVQKGLINKEKFHIPQDKAESYDGSVLRFSVSEEDVVNRYAEDSSPPSIEDQYESTTAIDSGGGSGGGIQVEEDEEKAIPLTDEKLDVTKGIQEDQATLTKEPVTETKTIEVPVTHEEVTIEIRPPSGQTKAQEPVSSEENITIPLKREEVEVSKTAFVKEEAVIKKNPVTESKEVSEETTPEKIDTPDTE